MKVCYYPNWTNIVARLKPKIYDADKLVIFIYYLWLNFMIQASTIYTDRSLDKKDRQGQKITILLGSLLDSESWSIWN